MTVFRVTVNRDGEDEYWGYSSDVKPTGTADVPRRLRNATKFTELDTGAVYLFFDGTWELDKRMIYAFVTALEEVSP